MAPSARSLATAVASTSATARNARHAAGAGQPGHQQLVLDGDRQSVQPAQRIAACHPLVGVLGLSQALLAGRREPPAR